MTPAFTVWVFVGRPPSTVYEAVADPDQLSAYFTTGGAVGRAEAGATASWEFADFPGRFPVEIVEATPPDALSFAWPRPGGRGSTRVRFMFEAVDDGARTRVSVHESGWEADSDGLTASYGNCMGWSQMLMAMKAWVEHGINLREGAYR